MTPPEPFLLTRMTRFTPAFSTQVPGSTIGTPANGARAVGTYWIVGRVLHVQLLWQCGSDCSGDFTSINVPLPLGYTPDDIDGYAMTGQTAADPPGFANEISALCNCTTFEGEAPPVPVSLLLEGEIFSPPSLDTSFLVFEFPGTGAFTAASGNQMVASFEVALKEPALPG